MIPAMATALTGIRVRNESPKNAWELISAGEILLETVTTAC
jgi:hypothetical protein